MLQSLHIKNIVLIDSLTLDFSAGMTALTGETGAGKSILLDALGLALGERSDAGLVRAGADSASVTATFTASHALQQWLTAQEFEASDEIVLRRTLAKDGKSKAFINDTPVTLTLVKDLAARLIEVEGQFGVHALLEREQHRYLLDAFVGLGAEVSTCRTTYEVWQNAQQQLLELQNVQANAAREQEWLQASVQELQEIAPQENEEDELLTRRQRLQGQEKTLGHLQTAWSALAGDHGAELQISGAQRAMQKLAELLPASATTAIAALDRAATDVAEAVRIIETEQAQELDGGQTMEALEDRLYRLRGAARKYQTTPTALPALLQQLQEKLALLDNSNDALQAASKAAIAAQKNYMTAAEKISAARQKAAGLFDKAVADELAPLKLEKAQFKTDCQFSAANAGPDGCDTVTFTAAMNPGSALTPLHKTASGGELARLLLALKVVLAKANPVPTLIFDEADTGLGGATAAAVGERLARLAQNIQVIVITHSPQVAAQAAHHYRITKHQQGKQVATSVVPLDAAARLEEVARMLAGETITPAARANAAELLGQQAKPKKKIA